jgi:hypothetical protein
MGAVAKYEKTPPDERFEKQAYSNRFHTDYCREGER